MNLSIIALIIAIISGIAMAVQGSLNSALGKVIGLLEATFIVHIIGTLVLIIALFIFQLGQGNLICLPRAPWYTYLGGIISVIIIYGVIASIPRLGVANATTAIIVGQVITAMAIDHFGWFGLEQIYFSWWKAAGMALLATGARLMLIR